MTPVCCCGGADAHSATWFIASSPSPKGSGRFVTVSEVALVVGLRAKHDRRGPTMPRRSTSMRTTGTWWAIRRNRGSIFTRSKSGCWSRGFPPRKGGASTGRSATFDLGGFSGPGAPSRTYTKHADRHRGSDHRENGIVWQDRSSTMANGDSSRAPSPAQAPPKEWIGWGGTLGMRFDPGMITFKPILFPLPAGQPLPPFSFSGTVGSANHLRLIVYDINSGPDAGCGRGRGQPDPVHPAGVSGKRWRLSAAEGQPDAIPQVPRSAPVVERMQESRTNGVLFGTNGLIHPGDIVQSLVPNHGDFRLLAAKRAVMQGRSSGVADSVGPRIPNLRRPSQLRPARCIRWPIRSREPKPERISCPSQPGRCPGLQNDFGYFTKDNNSVDLKLRPEYMPDFPIKPWEDNVQVRLVGGLSLRALSQGAISGGQEMRMPMRDVFNITRYDHLSGSGRSARYKRGAAQPDITGDFDTGVGPAIDGPYANHGDDGEVRGRAVEGRRISRTSMPPAPFRRPTPRCSRPTASSRRPGSSARSAPASQTMSRGRRCSSGRTSNSRKLGPIRDRQHYGSRYPRDHLFMDMFWMPVVQPYAISEPFETKGKINMNYQILPFTYITRATALHALFKSEKIMAIPDNRTDDYKIREKEGGASGPYKMADSRRAAVFRHFIDAEETLEQWEERFAGTDQASTSRSIKPGAFLSATEICDQWLVPAGPDAQQHGPVLAEPPPDRGQREGAALRQPLSAADRPLERLPRPRHRAVVAQSEEERSARVPARDGRPGHRRIPWLLPGRAARSTRPIPTSRTTLSPSPTSRTTSRSTNSTSTASAR